MTFLTSANLYIMKLVFKQRQCSSRLLTLTYNDRIHITSNRVNMELCLMLFLKYHSAKWHGTQDSNMAQEGVSTYGSF